MHEFIKLFFNLAYIFILKFRSAQAILAFDMILNTQM